MSSKTLSLDPALSRRIKEVKLKKVLELRDKIARSVGLLENYPREGVVKELTISASRLLGAKPAVVEQSILALLRNRELTGQTIKSVSWSLAANVTQLEYSRPLEPYEKTKVLEWVPVCFLGWHFTERNGTKGFIYNLLVLAGLPAGKLLDKFFGSNAVYFLSRALSLAKYNRYKPQDFVNMRAWICLDPDLCRFSPFNFERIECSPAFSKINRQLYQERQTACIYGGNINCYDCPETWETCIRATR